MYTRCYLGLKQSKKGSLFYKLECIIVIPNFIKISSVVLPVELLIVCSFCARGNSSHKLNKLRHVEPHAAHEPDFKQPCCVCCRPNDEQATARSSVHGTCGRQLPQLGMYYGN
jgi:hypothetical protein